MTLADVIDPWVALYLGLAAYLLAGLIVSTRITLRGVQGRERNGDPFPKDVLPNEWTRIEFWIAVAIFWVTLAVFWPMTLLFGKRRHERG